MLWSIQGKLSSCFPQHIIVDVRGFGLQVFIPASLYFKLPPPGEDILLYTYFQPREDSFTLYGFQESQERDFFVKLLGVGGIGPKVALSLLGHLDISQILHAVVNENATIFTSIPGIGNKTANRICYELKQKFDTNTLQTYLGEDSLPDKAWLEVTQALKGLGYSDMEIARAKEKLSTIEDTSVEILFRTTLAALAKK